MNSNTINIETSAGQIYIWEDFHYFKKLKSGINKVDLQRKIVDEKLLELGIQDLLERLANGQPVLKSGGFASISHSKNWFCIYLASEPVGIDIEHNRPNLHAGRSYFVNDLEEHFSSDEKKLQLIWGAKEAFYKQKSGEIDDLKLDVSIISIDKENQFIELEYKGDIQILNFRIIEGLCLVYTC